MTFSSKLKAAALASAATLGTFALAAGSPALAHDHGMKAEKSQPNIVEAAMGTGVHETLVAAVKAAGLVDTLASPGPFTIFAPTDDAFGKLPAGTVDTLLRPDNRDALRNILTYHVVPGSVTAADLVGLIDRHGGAVTIETVAGEELTASRFGDTIAVTDAAGRTTVVATADVEVSNGIIHVTDGVFLPG
ncbi:fasciclin domain-containing protein [Qipengyuania sp.]|uniref:fasciclin domain-containing protein n=1 Tax=Qipengyuania sp. TaxID=2004515 RepID=UPI003BACE055